MLWRMASFTVNAPYTIDELENEMSDRMTGSGKKSLSSTEILALFNKGTTVVLDKSLLRLMLPHMRQRGMIKENIEEPTHGWEMDQSQSFSSPPRSP